MKKIGIYGVYGFAVDASLQHYNPENHTYISHIDGIGSYITIRKKTVFDFKVCYRSALMGAYYVNGDWYNYSGLLLLTTLRFKLK